MKQMKTLTIDETTFEIVDEEARTKKLDADKLPDAINTALTQAKESGEFDGEKGVSGVHFGADTPPDDATVWVDPNGEPTSTEDWEFDMNDGTTDTKTVVVVGAKEANGYTGILRVKDANGKWVEIPAIIGKQGEAFTYEDFTPEQLAELKGEKGDPGYTPVKGKDYFDGAAGYTPQKGVDYFDGDKGDDGVSATHSWNGTTLTVKSASGTSSADLKGEKGDTGESGVVTPVGGFYTLSVDADGNLWVTSEDGNTPDFEYDSESGNLYVKVDGSNVLIGNVKGVKGDKGDPGSDANVTVANIAAALGYTPANEKNHPTVSEMNAAIEAIPTPDVSGQINAHNTATDAHNDIRLFVEGLATRLNALANSDDTTLDQMAEVVAYIKSNRSLIEEVTTNKVNVSDIIDNLTTNVANKPLSAAQGVALKVLVDALQTQLDGKAKLASPNNMIHNGNEYTFIPDNYYGEVYLNHRAGGGNHNGKISNYHFCNGSGQYATIIANYFKGKFQGADARPIYNNAEVAMLSDIPTTAGQVGALPATGGTVDGSITIQRANYPGFTLKNTTVNGEFAVTEADDGTALLQNNSDVTGANNYAALYVKPAETGINNFLQFGLSVNGAWSGGVILHSQNFNDHIPSETWTFTLADGSTVTKRVYAG